MTGKRILLILGGTSHDFDGFAQSMDVTLSEDGHRLEATYDRDTLTELDNHAYDLVMVGTCLSAMSKKQDPALDYTDAQVAGLYRWVKAGGKLLGVHAATTSGQLHPELAELMGGTFIEHPPQFSFTVYPLFREHPIIADINAFTVQDEFYIQSINDDVDIHMVAIDRGHAYPMVWTRPHGDGQVAYIGMGHDEKVWDLEPYQQLMRQAVAWL
jgi:type 1 glutamine amidotransferase